MSRHKEIGTITAVGSPLSLETYWISASGIVYSVLRFRGGGWPCESLGLPASNGARFGEADNFTPMARSGFRRDPRGVRGLMERGFSDEDILKILGGDTLRVMRDVEQISRQLKTEAAGGGRK